MSDTEIGLVVKGTVRGAADAQDVMRRVKSAFSPMPEVWATPLGDAVWDVTIQLGTQGARHNFKCNKA